MTRTEATTPSNATQTTEELLNHLAEHDCKARITSAKHIQDLQEEIEGQYNQGLLDKEFYHERLAYFDFRAPETLREAKSLIIVAIPRPQSQATFTWNGEKHALIVPPTYVANERTRRRIQKLLTEILAPKGYRVAPTALPLKLLATRSGLAEYGRNNICYVPNMGSFLQLTAFYSDLPCQKDNWQKPQMMKNCQNCHACQHNCPTNAIPNDRFLLHAERCIVYHNEKKGNIPFPTWISLSAHNCLVGCMHCQKICSQNKPFLQWIEEKEEFSQEETALLLQGASLNKLNTATKRKLKHLDLLEDADIIPRNLNIFLKRQT